MRYKHELPYQRRRRRAEYAEAMIVLTLVASALTGMLYTLNKIGSAVDAIIL